VGGSYSNSVFTPEMLSLRLQGVYGTYVPESTSVTNGNAGTFELSNDGLVGYSAGGAVTVNTFNVTVFNNLTGLSQLESTNSDIPLVVRGLLLDTNGTPEMYVGLVSEPSSSN
jgi:hypothetical protein